MSYQLCWKLPQSAEVNRSVILSEAKEPYIWIAGVPAYSFARPLFARPLIARSVSKACCRTRNEISGNSRS